MFCDKTSKHVHKSREKALKHLKQLKKIKGYTGKVFYCPFCRAFHLGRTKK